MPRFLIERNIPKAGELNAEQLEQVAQASNKALSELGPDIQWVQSYVTGDKITCVYLAKDAEIVREHARKGGFPADRVEEVKSIIDPMTAHGARWAEDVRD